MDKKEKRWEECKGREPRKWIPTCGRGDTRDGQVEMGGEVEWRLAVKVLFGEGEDVVVSKERDDLPGEDVVGGEGLWGATRVLF